MRPRLPKWMWTVPTTVRLILGFYAFSCIVSGAFWWLVIPALILALFALHDLENRRRN